MYEHLQQIHLQRPGFYGPSKFRQFAAKPIAATFLPLAALLLTAGHLQQNETLAAKPLAATSCNKIDHLQRNKPLAAKILAAK